MHYIKTVALAALAAVGVSSLPLSSRGLLTANIIPRPINDLIERNSALDVTDDKKYFGRQILSSRDAEASSLSPKSSHLSSPVSEKVKRVADDDDGGFWADLGDLFLGETQNGAIGDGEHPPPPGTIIA